MSMAWEGSHLDSEPVHIPVSVDSLGMEQIGEYIIRRLVGEGGMGKVFEAEERLSKRRVALKVLREELAKSERARGMFLNEMQILAHLEHPNIVRSLASIEADGKLVMVLEYLDGVTLRDVITTRERLSWEEATHVVSCVARALVAAHGQQPPVIHRDLKPENIMVLDDGSVKVMDFGIAKLIQQLNQTNTQSVGTLQYMSPEQIDAQSVDGRTDLYCLGLVYYELLAGHPPFQSASPRTLLNMQCTEAAPPLPDQVRAGLSKGIQKVLQEMLEKSPDARPASAREVVERLELFLPERSFASLAQGGGSATFVPEAISNRPRKDSVTVRPVSDPDGPVSPHGDTLPSVDGDTPLDEHRARRAAKAGKPVRQDTVALIEAAAGPRELSTAMSILIIVLLAAAAAAATYFWRASQAPGPGSNETEPATTGSQLAPAADPPAVAVATRRVWAQHPSVQLGRKVGAARHDRG